MATEPMMTLTMKGTTYEITDGKARQAIETLYGQMQEAQKAIEKKADPNDVPTASGIVDLIYPVGSVYLSVSSTNPSQLFGGTWEQITQGSIQQSTGNTGLFGTTVNIWERTA